VIEDQSGELGRFDVFGRNVCLWSLLSGEGRGELCTGGGLQGSNAWREDGSGWKGGGGDPGEASGEVDGSRLRIGGGLDAGQSESCVGGSGAMESEADAGSMCEEAFELGLNGEVGGENMGPTRSGVQGGGCDASLEEFLEDAGG